MTDLPAETEPFVAELDAAVEAHMNWTRRILRCAVLHATPGEDVLDPMAHTLCRFGAWFVENRAQFVALDEPAAHRVEVVHQTMHDAIRSLCTQVIGGEMEDLSSVVKRADLALYQGKVSGRDRYVIA
ncbi:MAG: hypothetical protein ACYC39_09725 [Thiobacillus sp.]|nr:hypothetical protein [Thiobacillus sp.]